VLLAVGKGVGGAVPRFNTGSNTEVAKSQVFDGLVKKVSGFLIVYKLFRRMCKKDWQIFEKRMCWKF